MESLTRTFPFNLLDKRWFCTSIVPISYSNAAAQDSNADTRDLRDDLFVKKSSDERTRPDAAEMKKVFQRFDENNDGVICTEELRRFMSKLGFEMSDEEVVALVKTVDENCDGSVDFEEFYSLYSSITGSTAGSLDTADEDDESLRGAFEVFDKNQDGYITVQELQAVLVSMGMLEGQSLKKCHQMIQSVDADGNGQVDFQEFKKMMSSKAFQS